MYSRQTPYLGLPQWEPKDHPDFLTDMNEAYRKLDSRLEELDGLTAEAVNKIEERVTANEKKIDNLESTVDTVQSNLADVTKRTEQNEDDIAGLKREVEILHQEDKELDELIKAETKARELADDAEQKARTEADAQLKKEIDSNEKRIDSLESTAEEYGDSIVELQKKDAEHDKEFESVHTEIVNLQEDVSDLRNHLGEVEGRVEGLEVTVSTIGEGCNQHGLDIESLNLRVDGNTDSISTLKTNLSSMVEEIKELQVQYTQMDSTVTTNTSDISDLKSDMAQIKEEQSDHEERISALEAGGGGGGTSTEWEPCIVTYTIKVQSTGSYQPNNQFSISENQPASTGNWGSFTSDRDDNTYEYKFPSSLGFSLTYNTFKAIAWIEPIDEAASGYKNLDEIRMMPFDSITGSHNFTKNIKMMALRKKKG